MPRVTGGLMTKKRHKRILKRAKGYYGSRSRLFRNAVKTVETADKYATRDRRVRKREFRSLWITRIGAVFEAANLNYSRFISALKKAKVGLNRKSLSEIAIHDPLGFQAIINAVRK